MAKEKEKVSVVSIILIIFCLLLMAGIISVAILQYKGIINIKDVFSKDNKATSSDADFEDGICYKVDSIQEITQLFTDYYKAMSDADQERLMTYVTDPSCFDDMTGIMQKAMLYIGYENIECYIIKGVNDNEYIVYVLCNINISGVACKPLDISKFYVVKADDGYIINNEVLSDDVIKYMSEINSREEIQVLYKKVMDDNNYFLEHDQGFLDFYNEIHN